MKKAYYKLSLLFHPQISGKKYVVSRKFQALGKIYSILSDVNKRRLYNREGTCIVHWRRVMLMNFSINIRVVCRRNMNVA